MITALLLRPLLKLANSPTVAATAASWGINTLQANVAALTAASHELDQAIAERRAELEVLDQAIAERRAELEVLDQAGRVYAEAEAGLDDSEYVAPCSAHIAPCSLRTLHGPHRWHMQDLTASDYRLADCPGVTTAPPPQT